MTVEEILSDLGVTVDPAKSDAVKTWNGKLAAGSTEAQQKLAEAQKKLEEAQALQRVVDENIASFGMTETNVAQLQASNAALKAALEEVKKAGFSGITIPELPSITPQKKDPMDEFRQNVVKGFTQMGQTMNEINRYYRVFGKAMPEDPATLADKAAAARLSVHDYVEQTYKVTAEEQKQQQESRQKEMDAYAEQKLKAYQEAHPSTAGNPNLNPGMPSNYPQIPKPRDGKSVREFASMSTREKIASAMQHAREAVTNQGGV